MKSRRIASDGDVRPALHSGDLLAVIEHAGADRHQRDVQSRRVRPGKTEDLVRGNVHAGNIGNYTGTVNGYLTGCPEEVVRSSYRTMNLTEILARIEERLLVVGLKADAASKLAKKPDAIRNIRRAVKDDKRTGITTATVEALAGPLQCSVSWLLTGEGPVQDRNNTVRVMGRVGAGAEILPEHEQVPPEGLDELETPFRVPEGAIAFEVEGDSMWPRYDPGDVIICWREGTNAEEVIGWEAAVQTSDGKRFLKRIVRGGEPGTYNLESHNAPPIRDVKLVWTAQIGAVLRADQWRKLSDKERGRMIKKAMA